MKVCHYVAQSKNDKSRDEVWEWLLGEATSNLRVELKLSEKYLKGHKLDTASAWTGDMPKKIFLSELTLLRLGTIPSLESAAALVDKLDDEILRAAYRLWLTGDDLGRYYTEYTLGKRRIAIKEAIGVDIVLDRAPMKLPPTDLAKVFCAANILHDFPNWIEKHELVGYQGGELAEQRNAAKRAA